MPAVLEALEKASTQQDGQGVSTKRSMGGPQPKTVAEKQVSELSELSEPQVSCWVSCLCLYPLHLLCSFSIPPAACWIYGRSPATCELAAPLLLSFASFLIPYP
jgi:hypothetical protein